MPNVFRSFSAALSAILLLGGVAGASTTPRPSGASSGGVGSIDQPRAAALVAEPGTRRGEIRLAVLAFTLPGYPDLPQTLDTIRTTYFGPDRSASVFYREASDGALNLTGDVFGTYAIGSADVRYCSVSEWADAARVAATLAGVDLNGYDYFAYVFPKVSACPWAGMADLGGTASYINGPTAGNSGLYHAIHELGHDLGAVHAHGARCRQSGRNVAIGDRADCTTVEYGDPFSVMGGGVVILPSAWDRLQMGLLPASDESVVREPGTLRYSIPPLDAGPAPMRLFLIDRGAAGGFLSVEYRQPSGQFDAFRPTDPAVNGVLLRMISTDGEASLIDATPATDTFVDAALLPGQSLTDAEGGISVTVRGADASGATIDVTTLDRTPDGLDDTAPLDPLGLNATTGNDGAVSLDWQPALDNVGVTVYRILRDGTPLGTVVTPAFLDSTPGAASRTYTVQAVDAAGNASTGAVVSFTVPDVTPPSLPSIVAARRLSPSSIRVRWNAALDDQGAVSYMVRVDGSSTQRVETLSRVLTGLSRGVHRIAVRAVDGAGNVSAPARATVRT